MPFKLITPLSSNNLSLSLDESFVMEFVYDSDGLIIKKTLKFSGNTYILNFDYSILSKISFISYGVSRSLGKIPYISFIAFLGGLLSILEKL